MACGVVGLSGEFLEFGDVFVYVREFHLEGFDAGSSPLFPLLILELVSEFFEKLVPNYWDVVRNRIKGV